MLKLSFLLVYKNLSTYSSVSVSVYTFCLILYSFKDNLHKKLDGILQNCVTNNVLFTY